MVFIVVVVVTVDVDAILFCDAMELLFLVFFGILLIASYYLAVVCAGKED